MRKAAGHTHQTGALVAAFAQVPLCLGGLVPLDTSIGATPIVRLTLGGVGGNFLLDTGATYSAVDAHTYNVPVGTRVSLWGFSLPSAAGGAFVAEDMHGYRSPPGGQTGRIGTDFLSLRAVELHYAAAAPFAIIGDTVCDPATLRDAGFVEIGLPGYYAANPTHLRLGPGKWNVPVVGLRIGPVSIPTQVDTGFDDEVEPGVLQINAAALEALRAGNVGIHPTTGPSTLGCDQIRGVNEYWQVDTASVAVTTPEGQPVDAYPPPMLEVKAGKRCGGIATFDEPFGQIGASWLHRWNTTVFDGPGERIWFRR
jgi:hypothetical protein